MKLKTILPILILLLVTVLYLLGTAAVPFHPDEATQIFMSGDLETLFRHPSDLFYAAHPIDAARQNYRLLDAPLTRWLIGIGRTVAGIPALPADWNWSNSWRQNEQAGALPSDRLLLVSRLSVAWLFALTLFFAYRTGVLLRGVWMGWLNVALTALNALVLLHTRRAMAESALFFAIHWLIFALAKKEANPWLLALPAALAINAKQTVAGLVVVTLAAAWLYAGALSGGKRLRNVLLCAVCIVLVTILLNPVAWKNPVAAGRAALEARSELAIRQVNALTGVSPEQVMQSPGQRLSGWLVYLFFSPPAAADVANYLADTQAAEGIYFSNPLNRLLRGLAGGVTLLVLSIFGFGWAGYRTLRKIPLHIPLALLLLATLLVFLTLVLFIPLPFQRYCVSLIPFTNLWIAFLLAGFIEKFKQRSSGREPSR